MHLGDNAVDEVDLRREALEEQVAVRRVHVRLDVDLRQVWLNDVEQLPCFACLDLLDLKVDMASLVLGRGRLQLEIQRHHRGGLGCRSLRLMLCRLSFGAQRVELANRL